MMNQNQQQFPLLGLLTCVLIVLKLMGLITISWWWVFAPLWIVIAIVVIVGFFIALLK